MTTSEWTSVGEVAKRVFNQNTPGCRDCGAILAHQTESGHVFWHPGVECCAPAIRRQIAWRGNDINHIQAEIAGHRKGIAELQKLAAEASYQSRSTAEAKALRAEESLRKRMREDYEPRLKALSSEIARLKRELAKAEAEA